MGGLGSWDFCCVACGEGGPWAAGSAFGDCGESGAGSAFSSAFVSGDSAGDCPSGSSMGAGLPALCSCLRAEAFEKELRSLGSAEVTSRVT